MADTNSDIDTGTEPKATGSPDAAAADQQRQAPKEIGGREGPEPTRFGDWEKAGRCIDF